MEVYRQNTQEYSLLCSRRSKCTRAGGVCWLILSTKLSILLYPYVRRPSKVSQYYCMYCTVPGTVLGIKTSENGFVCVSNSTRKIQGVVRNIQGALNCCVMRPVNNNRAVLSKRWRLKTPNLKRQQAMSGSLQSVTPGYSSTKSAEKTIMMFPMSNTKTSYIWIYAGALGY